MLRHKNYLFYPYQLYKYIVIYPLLGLSTSVLGIAAATLAIFVNPKAGTLVGVIWAKFNSYITPMFVKVIGKENIDPEKSYVVVANHTSLYDILMIYGWFPVDFKWVMKMELRRVPFLGYSCYKIGHIFIDRSNSQTAIETINKARERIEKGTSIMFFPEGTRSRDGNILPFKKGAFNFALDMNLPLLPVSITGTGNILPSKTTALFPGKAKMIIHEPLSIEGYSRENLEELIEATRNIIKKGIEEN